MALEWSFDTWCSESDLDVVISSCGRLLIRRDYQDDIISIVIVGSYPVGAKGRPVAPPQIRTWKIHALEPSATRVLSPLRPITRVSADFFGTPLPNPFNALLNVYASGKWDSLFDLVFWFHEQAQLLRGMCRCFVWDSGWCHCFSRFVGTGRCFFWNARTGRCFFRNTRMSFADVHDRTINNLNKRLSRTLLFRL